MFLLDSPWKNFVEQLMTLFDKNHIWWLLIPVAGLIVALLKNRRKTEPKPTPTSEQSFQESNPRFFIGIVIVAIVAVTILIIKIRNSNAQPETLVNTTDTVSSTPIDHFVQVPVEKPVETVNDTAPVPVVLPEIAPPAPDFTCEFLNGSWKALSLEREYGHFDVNFTCLKNGNVRMTSEAFGQVTTTLENLGEVKVWKDEETFVIIHLERRNEFFTVRYTYQYGGDSTGAHGSQTITRNYSRPRRTFENVKPLLPQSQRSNK